MARLYGYIDIAVFQITVDGISLDAIPNDVMPAPAHFPDEICMFRILFNEFCFAADSANHLPAISARGSPADSIGFEDTNVIASFRKGQCRRQTRKATADYADIHAQIVF